MSSVIQIVHLSDLHIRSKLDKAHDSSKELSAAGLKVRALNRYIIQHYPRAHVVVTGDVTDSGTPASMCLAGYLLGRFMARGNLHIVPGNHDCGTKGAFSYERSRWSGFHKVFTKALPDSRHYPWVKRLGHIALVGLDTTSAEDSFAEGRIGAKQLNTLDMYLQKIRSEGLVPVILMHHDPWYEGIFCRLIDAKEFVSIMKKHRIGPGPLVLFGHGHQTRLRRHVGKYTSGVGSTTYMASPSSVDSRGSRLRFRVITITLDGQISWTWDACPWQGA